jgi:glycosyltransferase involved in cell wall biosynthesis
MPKVSVTIPTHNRRQLLAIAVDSVLRQTFDDFELLVCDDGSTDDTPAWMASLTDERVRYIRHPQNIGKSNNMRSGFEAAQGEYFIKFDDDDRITPGFLAKTVAVLDQHPEVDFVGTDHWIIDITNTRQLAATEENCQRWKRHMLAEGKVDDLLTVTFLRQSFQIGATLFRRQALADVGYMRPDLQNCEDNDLLVRLAIAGKQAYYLPERLMEYRVHAGQQGLGRAIQYLRDEIQYLQYFQFDVEKLETTRQRRLAETQLALGLRLVEAGQITEGRQLIQAGRSCSGQKARAGLLLSYLPTGLRKMAFSALR